MNYITEQILSTEITTFGAIFKLLLSLCLGALIGTERRHKGQAAGMRTFALIAMGATLAMIISIYIPQEYMGLKNGDPGRIAAQVISGIGFLGAGAIIQMKGSVRGLTTAAGIWMTACLGLAIGAGMYIISIFSCLFIIGVLKLFEYFEKKFLKGAEMKIIRIKVNNIISNTDSYRECLKQYNVHISDEFLRFDYNSNVTTINYMIRSNDATNFVGLFASIHEIDDIASLTLTNEVNN
jgi:putative Mg2+ transporter-C (MgtC) family protein